MIEYIDKESKPEAEVCETEEIQVSISENISQINKFLESREEKGNSRSLQLPLAIPYSNL